MITQSLNAGDHSNPFGLHQDTVINDAEGKCSSGNDSTYTSEREGEMFEILEELRRVAQLSNLRN